MKIYKGSNNISMHVETGMDVSTATKLAFKVKKPDGTETEWIGSLGVTNTQIDYLILASDISIPGSYKLQAYVEMPGGFNSMGDTFSFIISNKFS